MTFISWLVFGVLFMVSEFATGTFYLLAIGLAFVYPAIAAYVDASTGMQLALLGSGTLAHALIVMIVRKLGHPAHLQTFLPTIGQQVEVIEWIDESSARVMYGGSEWEADKMRAEMPSSSYGIINSVQGSRLIISTE